MKPLSDYQTPLTDAAHEGRSQRYLGGTVDFKFTADLERRLSLCRYALAAIKQAAECHQLDGLDRIEWIAMTATDAIDATK